MITHAVVAVQSFSPALGLFVCMEYHISWIYTVVTTELLHSMSESTKTLNAGFVSFHIVTAELQYCMLKHLFIFLCLHLTWCLFTGLSVMGTRRERKVCVFTSVE